jgi:hypothetical protein
MKYTSLFGRMNRFFFEEADDLGGGTFEAQPGEGNPPSNAAPAVPSFDPRAIAQELGNVLTEHQKQNESQRPKTPEEIVALKKELRIWDPTDEWLTKFDNMDTRKAAITEMRDGLFGQAFEAARRYYAEREEAILSRMSPLEQHYQKAANEQIMSGIYQGAPELKQYQPVVDRVIAHLQISGQRFNSVADLTTAIRKGVEEVVAIGTPGFKLSPEQTTNKPGSIPATSSGSGGGGGRQTNSASAGKPRAVQLLEG